MVGVEVGGQADGGFSEMSIKSLLWRFFASIVTCTGVWGGIR